MNYNVIKYIVLAILILSNVLLFVKFKENTKFKYFFLIVSVLFGTCLLFSKYQYYATDNVNRQCFPISSYNYNDDETEVKIEYYNEDNNKISMNLKADEVAINMSNGLGEVEKRQREYKKEILVFNTIQIPLGSNFQSDTDLVVLNQTNFMSEEELQEYYEYMEQINNPINQENLTENNEEVTQEGNEETNQENTEEVVQENTDSENIQEQNNEEQLNDEVSE